MSSQEPCKSKDQNLFSFLVLRFLVLALIVDWNGLPVCCDVFCSPLSTGILYGRLQRVTIPGAVIIQFCPPEDEHSTARNMLRIIM